MMAGFEVWAPTPLVVGLTLSPRRQVGLAVILALSLMERKIGSAVSARQPVDSILFCPY